MVPRAWAPHALLTVRTGGLHRLAVQHSCSIRHCTRHPQAVFTNYGFHYPLTVALLQMAFIAPVSYAVARPQVRAQQTAPPSHASGSAFLLQPCRGCCTALLHSCLLNKPPAVVCACLQLSWALVKQLGPLAMVNVLNVVCGLIGAWAETWPPIAWVVQHSITRRAAGRLGSLG